MNKEYAELLRDPRWKAKRLIILERDGWKCRECDEHQLPGRSLQVHHVFYEWNRKPWTYPNHSLLSLCDHCHKDRERSQKQLKIALNCLMVQLTIPELDQLAGAMMHKGPALNKLMGIVRAEEGRE